MVRLNRPGSVRFTPASCMPRRQSGVRFIHSPKSQRLGSLMENGDWKGVLQHRLPGICPHYLDLLPVVAQSGGSNVPPAVHVSSGKHSGAVVGGNSGLVRSVLVSEMHQSVLLCNIGYLHSAVIVECLMPSGLRCSSFGSSAIIHFSINQPFYALKLPH